MNFALRTVNRVVVNTFQASYKQQTTFSELFNSYVQYFGGVCSKKRLKLYFILKILGKIIRSRHITVQNDVNEWRVGIYVIVKKYF